MRRGRGASENAKFSASEPERLTGRLRSAFSGAASWLAVTHSSLKFLQSPPSFHQRRPLLFHSLRVSKTLLASPLSSTTGFPQDISATATFFPSTTPLSTDQATVFIHRPSRLGITTAANMRARPSYCGASLAPSGHVSSILGMKESVSGQTDYRATHTLMSPPGPTVCRLACPFGIAVQDFAPMQQCPGALQKVCFLPGSICNEVTRAVLMSMYLFPALT